MLKARDDIKSWQTQQQLNLSANQFPQQFIPMKSNNPYMLY
jgi:hypothetical protein